MLNGEFNVHHPTHAVFDVEQPGFQKAFSGRLRHAKSPALLVDLLAILPFFLEAFFNHLFDLRFLRVFRLMRLLKLTRYTGGYDYFRKRLKEARRDVEHGLRITLAHYTTLEAQQRMLEILQFKLDVLWSMLDAMSMAYELERPPYHTVTQARVWHRGITL